MFKLNLDVTIGNFNLRFEFTPFNWKFYDVSTTRKGYGFQEMRLNRTSHHCGPVKITFTNLAIEEQFKDRFITDTRYC